ncbi:MAG TPA: MarC family protein [Myxococcales bacterium]|nr:MarC family protein [Myxococcales bacterium]
MSAGEYATFSLVTFSGIFAVVDPFTAVPAFLAMTPDNTRAERAAMARRASLAALLILAGFALAGGLLFKFFGVTLSAFKLAGGLLLLLMAIDMLRAQPSRTRQSPEEAAEGVTKDDVAIFPLATPLLAGPGSIATTMVFMGRSTAWWQTLPVFVSIVLTCLVAYLLLRSASLIDRFMGRTGMNVLNRIMGLILAAIAMQFMIDGLQGAFPRLLGVAR